MCLSFLPHWPLHWGRRTQPALGGTEEAGGFRLCYRTISFTCRHLSRLGIRGRSTSYSRSVRRSILSESQLLGPSCLIRHFQPENFHFGQAKFRSVMNLTWFRVFVSRRPLRSMISTPFSTLISCAAPAGHVNPQCAKFVTQEITRWASWVPGHFIPRPSAFSRSWPGGIRRWVYLFGSICILIVGSRPCWAEGRGMVRLHGRLAL